MTREKRSAANAARGGADGFKADVTDEAAVQNLFAMRFGKRAADLLENMDHAPLGLRTVALDERFERHAVEVFEHEGEVENPGVLLRRRRRDGERRQASDRDAAGDDGAPDDHGALQELVPRDRRRGSVPMRRSRVEDPNEDPGGHGTPPVRRCRWS